MVSCGESSSDPVPWQGGAAGTAVGGSGGSDTGGGHAATGGGQAGAGDGGQAGTVVPTYGAPETVDGYALGGSAYGGGPEYPTLAPVPATNTATSFAELKSKVEAATTGQVVFVPSGTTITFGADDTITVPAGVTIASDRGKDGAVGGMLKKSESPGGYQGYMLAVGGDNVRITGLVLEGEMIEEGGEHPQGGESYLLIGVKNPSSYSGTGYGGLVVDNCEIRGWGYAGVFVQGIPPATRPHIHHCYIHHNNAAHMGYGCNVNGGDMLVEANVFDWNRHSVSAGGLVGERYEVRYNLHLGHGSQTGGYHYDVHENENYGNDGIACAGTEYHIHHNTVNQGSGTAQMAFSHIRDNPIVGAYINNNLIDTYWGDYGSTNDDGAPSVIYKSHDYSETHAGVFCTDNQWHGVVYPTNDGILWLM
jgi:hypothetical protein